MQVDAVLQVRKLEAKRDAGKLTKAGRSPTVEEWMDTYLNTICARLVASGKKASRTLDDYRSKSRKWVVPIRARRSTCAGLRRSRNRRA